MPDTIQTEWLNQNALRNYPFREDASLVPRLPDGTPLDGFSIPLGLLTDFVMTVDSSVSTDIYLGKIINIGGTITLVFSSNGSVAATTVVDKSAHVLNKAYRLSGSGDYDSATGVVVVGSLADLDETLPDGVYNFGPDDAPMEYRCVRPSAGRVGSISVSDAAGDYVSKKLRGNVKLVPGSNISLKYDESDNSIRISADGNAGYNDVCGCGKKTTVKTINGISVENVTLIGDDCVQVTTEGNTIRIKDVCSKPCCGCAEIDFINEKIGQLNTSLRKLETYAGVLDTRMTELKSAYTLADSGKRT